MRVQPSTNDFRLASMIATTAVRFEAVFDRAKPIPAGAVEQIAFGSLGDGNCSSHDKIARAIAYARANGWLHKLIEQYIAGDEVAADSEAVLDEALQQEVVERGSTLQSMIDAARGLGLAGIELHHFSRAMRQVCRIDIDGNPKGTGFLVQPNIVMTAWHVVRSLTDLVCGQAGDEVLAQADTAKRIRIVFDDIDVLRNGYRARLPGFSVTVAEQWLAGASPCHSLELVRSFPDNFTELSTRLDYALIKLSGIPRVGIPPVTVRERPIARHDKIIVFQHPDGRALSFDRAEVTDLYGDWRFKHNVNAQGGSSGSPCFDRDFKAVGIHQAGMEGAKSNRGVPLMPMLPKLKTLPPPDPWLTPMSDLTEGRPGHPVFGRLETQEWVWRQLDGGDRPILTIWANKGEGKSFTYDMLRSLLPHSLHDVVKLGAGEDIQKHTPEDFAALLLNRLGYDPMASIVFEANAERPRWLKDTHLPGLLRALEVGRASTPNAAAKGVWIVIDDIDKAATGSSTEISDYLFRLYAAARDRKWLRFVLLGHDGALPEKLWDAAIRHELTPPTDDHLKCYLRAKLPPTAYEAQELILDTTLFTIRDNLDDVPRAKRLECLQRKMMKVAQYWLMRNEQ